MSEAKKEATIFELADQFIALANKLSAQEQDVGRVGSAMRFAAARFNAFEASVKSADLAAEKDSAIEWFSGDYREMLNDNIEDHIRMASSTAATDNAVQTEEPAKDDAVQIFNT